MTTLTIGPHGFPMYDKDPLAEKDYQFDWTAWLAGDTITAHEVTVPGDLTLESHSESNGVVTAWLSGGTHGQFYKVRCKVVTQGGRTDFKSIEIRVREQ